MLSTIRKWIIILITTVVVIILGLLGYNVYLNYKKTKIKEVLEKERQEKLEQIKKDEQLQREIAEMEKERLQGWTPPANSYSILSVENINHLGMIEHPSLPCQKCHACENCQAGEDCDKMQPKLIFTRKVQEYIFNVIESITKKINGDELDPDGYNDNVSPFLKRYNAALYGAAGTGKTELVNELVHHLYEKFRNPKIIELTKEIEEIEQELEKLQTEQNKITNKNPNEVTLEDKKLNTKIDHVVKQSNKKQKELEELQKKSFIPPVFKIDGVQLQTGGAVATQPNPEEKLRKIIEKCKKQYFDDAYSDKPYIVFIEEADQGKNVMTAEKGKLLEEFKNFISTSEDKAGLRAKAQDPNSIIIIATNNFEQIDPAVVRRGRLGEKLNFNWTPALLEEYGKRNDSEWERVNWPKNDPSWMFSGNANYQDLYKMTSRFGYSKFSDNFTLKKTAVQDNPNLVNKANQIIKSYQTLSKNTEWKKAKEKELGKMPTGKKIMEKNKEGVEKEVDEKICNWLLHFLYTFHDYNDRQDLDSFNSADDIRAYDFGDAFAAREAIWGIYEQLGEEVHVLNVTKNIINDINKEMKSLKGLIMEINDVNNQLKQIEHKINETDRGIDDMKNQINNNLKLLQGNIDKVANQSANSGEISSLQARLSVLESKVSSGSYGGGSSSGSGSGSGAQAVKDKLDTLLEELRGNLSNMNSTDVFNKVIVFYNDIRNL